MTNDTGVMSEDEIDQTLADLTDEITDRIESGESVRPGDYARSHPEHVEQIDRLLPTLHRIVVLGQSLAARRLPFGHVPN